MRRKLFSIAVAGLILLLGSGLAYTWGTPRLLSIWPEAGSVAVPAGETLRLSFSRPMNLDSITQRLVIEPERPGSFEWQGNTLVFLPGQPWPSGETVRVRLEAGARAAGLLALPLEEAVQWTFTVAQPRLAYLFPADGPPNVWALNPLSGESEQLTQVLNGVSDFDVGLNGSAIFFSVNIPSGGSEIYRLDLLPASASEEASPQKVLVCPQSECRSPRLSPDGQWMAYEQTGQRESGQPTYTRVMLLSLPGGSARPAGDPEHQTISPVWSSTGLLAFYDSKALAYIVVDPEGGEVARFENTAGQAPSWSPDGRSLVAPEVIAVDLGENDTPLSSTVSSTHLMRYALDDQQVEDLSGSEKLEDAFPAFSPDGASLAFARRFLDVSNWTPGRQLWLVRADGSDPRLLAEDPFYNHFQFAWSPSGDMLAFVRFNQNVMTDPPELWLVDPESANAALVMEGAFSPRWIP